ncbi:thiamine phosphate synthase [Pelagibius litoralis]|uniref:Thiamine-phosphate synthase n=1 Tax=Pelagibius litoralis TaxID=374515 RepID=A0A967EVD3_9PROT|nr:thiamine phosphate synthase [Pelagibius litoralis]NIA68511.1 thiamine phosphate synthase [Pelagibius litoralis]
MTSDSVYSGFLDLRVYFVIGPGHAGDRPVVDLAGQAAEGGATAVQLRDKAGDTAALVARARALKAVLSPLGVPLIVNDRVDVALAAEADGVHIGQRDMAAADARRLLGPDRILGLTVQSAAEIAAMDPDILDYVSIGGVFATASKQNPHPPIGLDGLARLAVAAAEKAPGLPVCAIAGITAETAGAVIAAGCDGVAVVSAIAAAPDPAAAARGLGAAVDRALGQRRARA